MPKRLLIVDDNPYFLTSITAFLRAENFDVTTALNGSDALLRLAKSLPDLIISEVSMPVMNGYKFARQLRSAPHTKLIPIIFLAAKAETRDRIEAFRAGGDIFLSKPFDPDELIAVIKSILERVERTRTAITKLVSRKRTGENAAVRDEELTNAEWRVARQVARGLGNKEIAAELNLSIRTIESHVSRILAKKKLSNRVEIARLILSGI